MSTATLERLDFDLATWADDEPVPRCETFSLITGDPCDREATHVAFCRRRCGRLICLLCPEHALVLAVSDSLARHDDCGATCSWAELLRVVEI